MALRRQFALVLLVASLTSGAFSQHKKASKLKPVPPPPPQSTSGKSAEQEKPSEPMSSKTFDGLKLRSIGPAMISGRVVSFAVDPKNHAHFYVGAASGGVWKTENDGTTWTPVFEHEGSYSIGTVVLDPNDSNIVWVGTGESNSQRSVGYGDGIYRSEDGGKNWKNMGLKRSEHIGRIVIDPHDSNVIYVAAEGPLWGPGGERGLFKTNDGGKSWRNVLKISENTGVGDVAMDPENPDVLYATAYQRRRRVWTLIDGGPESAIYKSTDAGATWSKLKEGLPTEDMGRIGLAISPADHNVVYATIEAANKKGGIFRSSDQGATWEKQNPFDQTAMYYAQIAADPKNVDRVYVMNFSIMVSNDGGKTLTKLPSKSKHVDNHVIWIDPDDTNHYLVGCDGGVYESWDRAVNWQYKANLPLAQFYDVTVDNALPFYNVYGGTQDNNNVGGPSQTTSSNGITNADWFITQGGDGFRSQVDPVDPNTVYAEYQEGGLTRYDKRTGEQTGIQPQEEKGIAPYRWNWDSPILISPHAHTRLYFAANKLFRSDDRGDTWRAISPDLSRQIDRNSLPIMGKVWGPDAVAKNASTSFYGNIVALTESPKKEGLIYAGTDDGLIQITEDGGQNWRKLEKFPGVPEMTYVSRLAASNHDVNTVYAAFDGHKNADFQPYLLKSADAGRSWNSIAGNLPENGTVLGFAEDTVNPNLLFAGTEFGLYFTVDGGKKWIQLKSGLPTIPVRDIVIQPREGDLVLATFGRGFYILDDIRPLRNLKPESLDSSATFISARDAFLYNQVSRYGSSKKAHLGESFYTGENPAFGTAFTYYLKDKLKTKKELRQESEKQAANADKTGPYPSRDELRAETEEEAPALLFTIADGNGKVVRKLTVPADAGMHRVAWDLRYAAPALAPETPSEGDFDFEGGVQPPLVMPGTYTVMMATQQYGKITAVGQPLSFIVKPLEGSPTKPDDRTALAQFQRQVAGLYRAVNGASETADELKSHLKSIKRALLQTPAAGNALQNRADAIEAANNQILRALKGDEALRSRNEPVPLSIEDRVVTIMDEERLSSSPPTQTHLQSYKLAAEEFTQQLAKLHTLIEGPYTQLEKDIEAAGAPWTPGRIPSWQK